MSSTKVGIIGCGDILDAYMTGLNRFGSLVSINRVADVDQGRAVSAANAIEFRTPEASMPCGPITKSTWSSA